jgi:hypothetical protein
MNILRLPHRLNLKEFCHKYNVNAVCTDGHTESVAKQTGSVSSGHNEFYAMEVVNTCKNRFIPELSTCRILE